MFVYHVSSDRNRESIRTYGILKSAGGIDGPGIYVWTGDLKTAVMNADQSLLDSWGGDESKLKNLDLWMAEIPDDTPTTIEWEDYSVLDIDKIPAEKLVLVGDFLQTSNELADFTF